MNGVHQNGWFHRWGVVAAWLLAAMTMKADPIPVSGPLEPPIRLVNLVPITLAILLEAVCVLFILRRRRKPRLFILWLLGMHVFTYPLFLGLLWLCYGMRPALAAALGEGVIVLVEGGLIFLMCRFLSARKSPLAVPSIGKSLFASLMGNICSAAAFPLLLLLFERVQSGLLSSGFGP
jgi:hypothetical protein